jgi:hypothetical protein
MKWLTIKLMQHQLKKAKKQHEKEERSIIKKAMAHMVKSYENTIMFLEIRNKN